VDFQHCCCMVAHSSNMQDPSQNMLLRHLQDTTFPFHHHHYSSIPPGITPDSSSSCFKDVKGLIPTYMHLPGITSSIHCDALLWTQHYHALGMPTHWLPQHRDCSLLMLASRAQYQDTYRQCTIIISMPMLPYSLMPDTRLVIITL
jgi:hypothetical protein